MSTVCAPGQHDFRPSTVRGFYECRHCPAKAEKRGKRLLIARATFLKAKKAHVAGQHDRQTKAYRKEGDTHD